VKVTFGENNRCEIDFDIVYFEMFITHLRENMLSVKIVIVKSEKDIPV
jgi:hypothetical protein